LIELIVVLAIIIIALSLAFWSLQNRSSHYRLRASARELLSLLKLAQASAIRSNLRFGFLPIAGATSYKFQQFDTGVPGWVDVPGSEGKVSQTIVFPKGITFVPTATCGGVPGGCGVVGLQFNTDGTLNSAATMALGDGQESFNIQWSFGGSIRIQ
jgi:type II secretory pathway pseudopilin PulG